MITMQALRILRDLRILDCGHTPSPHSDSTTGTARTMDDREICWDCANAEEIAAMSRSDRYGAYLSGDGRQVTTWTGYPLARVTWISDPIRRYTPTGGMYETVYINAVDHAGNKWHGSGPGNGMYCRIRRTKGNNR